MQLLKNLKNQNLTRGNKIILNKESKGSEYYAH